MRKFPTYTHLFIDFEALFWWRGGGKALFQTDSQNSLKSHPSVTFFSVLPLHPEGKVSTCTSAVVWERKIGSSFILKRNRNIPPGDGFTCMREGDHVISISCGEVSYQCCNFWENSWGSYNFPYPLHGSFKTKILRFLFIVKTNHQKTGTGDMKCKTPQ